ncbi:MAG TPA: ester cyclase [Pirellulales bacterium]|nr:ester cyclase [Pirellulales bacterium]
MSCRAGEPARSYATSFSWWFPPITQPLSEPALAGLLDRWRVAMTHTGKWMGMPPTGRRVAAHGSTWIRIADGIFVEGWDYWEQQRAADAVRSRRKPPKRR